MTKNWKKSKGENFVNIFFISKTTGYNLPIPGLHKGRQRYRRSLQPSKENIQHFTSWNFSSFFYFCGTFWPPGSVCQIRIRIHLPDLIPIPYGSESLILTTWFSYPIDECKIELQDTVIKNVYSSHLVCDCLKRFHKALTGAKNYWNTTHYEYQQTMISNPLKKLQKCTSKMLFT